MPNRRGRRHYRASARRRRHITDRDVRLLRQTIQTRMNLEMAVTDEMLDIAIELKPHFCCLVPEKREVTTEGGLDVAGQLDKMGVAVGAPGAGGHSGLAVHRSRSSPDRRGGGGGRTLYRDPHRCAYAEAQGELAVQAELRRIAAAAYAAKKLKVNAGHGLTYHNVQPIARCRKCTS